MAQFPFFLFDENGQLISDKEQKRTVWKNYYSNLLSRPPVSPSEELIKGAIEAIPDPSINCNPPTVDKVARAIGKLKSGNAAGAYNIVAEMLNAGCTGTVKWLTAVIRATWESGNVPADWKKGIILPFYKGKGSKKDCKNYRGIMLLSVPEKMFAHILLDRVKDLLLAKSRREQSGFTSGRSTTDRILRLNALKADKKGILPVTLDHVCRPERGLRFSKPESTMAPFCKASESLPN